MSEEKMKFERTSEMRSAIVVILILLFLSLTLWDDSLKRYMRLEITPLEFRMLERF